MRTLLFDIDGTLLLSGGGGREAMRHALSVEFGVHEAWAEVCFSGRTDRFLMSELLTRNGIEPNDESCQRFRGRYVSLFPQYVQAAGGRVLPGVVELLQRLSQDPRVRVAVMTGNLLATATMKLEHFGLHSYPQWIVSGDLDVERDAMARRAADSIRQRFGKDAVDDLVVIGDSPHDVRCGHAIGAAVVAVCTGLHSRKELSVACERCGFVPQAVCDDFSDWQRVYEWLVSDQLHVRRTTRSAALFTLPLGGSARFGSGRVSTEFMPGPPRRTRERLAVDPPTAKPWEGEIKITDTNTT